MRLHLFEFEDLEWFPDVIRKGQTDYLHFMINKFNIYKPAAGAVKELMDNSGCYNILDLCSGGGGGMDLLQSELENITGKDIHITLSDKFPNIEAFNKIKQSSGGKLDYISIPVDAQSFGIQQGSIVTIFSAFHHFNPGDAKNPQRGTEHGRL